MMDVSFESKKLQKICNSESKLRGGYGDRMAAKIQLRLLDLSAAESLAVMRTLPGRCHELRADRSGQLALDLVHPARLIFKPDHVPIPTMKGGNLNWDLVTKVIIVEIYDYHK